MPAKIQRVDIITDDAIRAPLDLADNLKAPLKELDKLLKGFKTLGGEIKASVSLSELRNETTKLTTAQTELDKVNKQIATTIQKNSDEYIKQQKVLAALKQEIKDKIALGDRDATTINKLNASMRVLSAALEKNRRDYAALTTEEERASATGLKLVRIIDQQDKELKELDATIGKFNRSVGDYSGGILNAYHKIQQLERGNKDLLKIQGQLTQKTAEEREQFAKLGVAIQNNITQINQYNQVINKTKNTVGGLVGQFMGALGLVGFVYLAINAIRDFINVNKDFEKSLSTLRALTGASVQDMQFFKKAAIDIGAETKRSAKDVVESFKLIAGARPDLLENKEALAAVTREAIILANAASIELPDAADALAGVLNQLQLPAEEAARAINTLAAGAKFGAAEIPDINAAYKQFGAVLRGVNGSIEQGVGLIELLAERQIKGAEAGTALRNVLLKLAAVNVLPKSAKAQLAKFGVDLKIVGDNTLPVNERLRELSKIAGDASALVKVFGVENFVAGNIVLNNVDKFEKLTASVTGTTEAYDQAAIATDNLEGDTASARAEVEALTLEMGEKTQGTLRKIVQGFTFFVKVLRELPNFLVENRALFGALALAVIALNVPLITATAITIKSIAVDRLKMISLASLTAATRTFYATLAANPFGVVLLGIAALIAAVNIYDRNSERSRKIAEKSIALDKDLEVILRKVKEARQQLNLSIDEFIEKSPAEQKAIRDEVLLRKQQALDLLRFIKIKEDKIKQDAREITTSHALIKVFTDLVDTYEESQARIKKTQEENATAATEPFQQRIAELEAEIEQFDDFIKGSTEAAAAARIENNEKEKDSAYKLSKFRIEQAIKTQEEIRDAEKNSELDRLNASTAIIKLSNKLAAVERNHDLENVKLTASEKLYVEEQYQANLIANEKLGVKERETLLKSFSESNRKYTEAILKANIQANENIINNDKSTLEQRNKAALEIADAKQLAIDINNQREIESAKENATELLRIQVEYNAASQAIAKELAENTKKNYFAVFNQEFGKLNSSANAAKDQLLKALNEQFTAGEVSLSEYINRTKSLNEASQAELLQLQLQFVKERLDIYEKAGLDVTALQQQLAEVEVAIAQNTADKKLEIEQKIADKLEELHQAIYDRSIQIAANLTASENQRLDNQLNALKENYDRQVELAGDNERRKNELSKKFAKEEKRIVDEKNKNLRRQAIIEKAVNATRSIVNTARAVTEVLPNIPLAVIIGALGALELATILTAPIPQFKDGGKTPGGLVLVSEEGKERYKLPSGTVGYTPDKPTLMNFPKNTEITNHDQTMRDLALAQLRPTDYSLMYGRDKEIIKGLGEVNASIQNISLPVVNYYRSGSVVYAAKKSKENFVRRIRAANMGDWVK